MDSDKILQVLTNLLSNAIKFSPPQEEILINSNENDSEAYIEVINKGEGIPEKDHHRVFERFFQVDSSSTKKQGGTGLGLSIAKEIIEKHGGMIDFESTPNHQTNFYFTLPKFKE